MSKLKQIYVFPNHKPSPWWSYRNDSSSTSIPIQNPVGEYSIQITMIRYNDIHVKILTAPEPVLAGVDIRMSQSDFTKCLEKDLFHKVQNMVVIKGTFQIYAGFLKLIDK